MSSGLAALRILVVDDKRQMRSIIGTVLTAAGVGAVDYAADGRRGLGVIATQQIDAAFVDFEMPHMNGLEFISAVRSMQSATRYMPLIMLTAHSDMPRLVAARDSGMTEFLCKPVTATSILSRLEASILQARPFVSSDDYFGPDRRRRRAPEPPQRRRSDQESREI